MKHRRQAFVWAGCALCWAVNVGIAAAMGHPVNAAVFAVVTATMGFAAGQSATLHAEQKLLAEAKGKALRAPKG